MFDETHARGLCSRVYSFLTVFFETCSKFLAGEGTSIVGLIFLNDDAIVIGNLFEVVDAFKGVVTTGPLLTFDMNIIS